MNDGTGFFSSKQVHCDNCCEKHHKDGSVTYYHQMLGAVIAHPEFKEVIPICPEPIMKEDGSTKNDCERNAAVRLLQDFRREHPHLPTIVVEDAHNTWITDLTISETNCYQIAKGGRVRWHIENETFNTLKNQDYHFEHNFGHGHKYLSTVFAMLMMLAFLIDQSEQLCCGLFQAALKKVDSKKSRLWRYIRQFFDGYIIPSWEILYQTIINEGTRTVPILDSS